MVSVLLQEIVLLKNVCFSKLQRTHELIFFTFIISILLGNLISSLAYIYIHFKYSPNYYKYLCLNQYSSPLVTNVLTKQPEYIVVCKSYFLTFTATVIFHPVTKQKHFRENIIAKLFQEWINLLFRLHDYVPEKRRQNEKVGAQNMYISQTSMFFFILISYLHSNIKIRN